MPYPVMIEAEPYRDNYPIAIRFGFFPGNARCIFEIARDISYDCRAVGPFRISLSAVLRDVDFDQISRQVVSLH